MTLLYSVKEGLREIKMHWYEQELHEELCRRKKGQHLSQKQRDYIYRLIRRFPRDCWSIKTAYKLSLTTYNKLVKTGNFVYRQKSF